MASLHGLANFGASGVPCVNERAKLLILEDTLGEVCIAWVVLI